MLRTLVQKRFSSTVIRNIGIAAHIDAGKTTTTEGLLYSAGVIKSIGKVDYGSTVMDFMEQEQERGITIQSAAITFPWTVNGVQHKINLIDTPGHADFTIEVERALRVLDGSVVVVDAGHGVEAQTEKVWEQSNRYQIPRIVFVNKMDREDANFAKCMDEVQNLPHVGVVLPLHIPLRSQEKFFGFIDVLKSVAYEWNSNDGNYTSSPIQEVALDRLNVDRARKCREYVVESLAELDDNLLETVLSHDDSSAVHVDDIMKALRAQTIARKCTPMLCGSALRLMGMRQLLDYISLLMPEPNILDRKSSCSYLFKVTHDKRKGAISYVRVYSGVLTSKTVLKDCRTNKKRRIERLYSISADELREVDRVEAGNIAAIVGLGDIESGDTLYDAKESKHVEPLSKFVVPPTVFACAIEAQSAAEEPRLLEALSILQLEDPSFKVDVNTESGQTIIRGMGELHLEIMLERLRSEFKVKCRTGPLWISYREAIKDSQQLIASRNNLKLTLTPYKGDTSAEQNHVDCSQLLLPSEYANLRGAIEKEVERSFSGGPLLHFPVINIQAKLQGEVVKVEKESLMKDIGLMMNDCLARIRKPGTQDFVSPYSMSSTELCEHSAFTLLEPTMRVTVICPASDFRKVLQDLVNERRGVVQETDVVAEESNSSHIIGINQTRRFLQDTFNYTATEQDESKNKRLQAIVPLNSMLGYGKVLRTITGGYGQFDMEFIGYNKVGRERVVSVVESIRGF